MFDTQVIDHSTLNVFRQDLGKKYKLIFGYFQEDGARSIAAIEEAVRQRNTVALVRPAHTLKGESLQFGAEPLGRLAERIELAARNAIGSSAFPSDVIDYVAQLRPLFDEVLAVLTQETRLTRLRRVAGFSRKIAFGF